MPQGGPGIRVLPCQCFRHAELSQELSLAQEACGGRLSRALAANSISPVDPEDGECGTRAQGNHALSHPFEQRTHCELGDSDPFNPHRNAAASCRYFAPITAYSGGIRRISRAQADSRLGIADCARGRRVQCVCSRLRSSPSGSAGHSS
ncbi:hypothetical protein PYCCODRAFT_1036695 [Trametes coccinea BRFM310]|uniref:Uncharacterized protein n=1 Tax=Trametes coccinea (strain BRFM310) TaxID=1353009 RepID=A0A1Y2IAJ2_TRAC3|nr:hypothetical protein PYCCODRAFT_1036695 [Trametes coccinea BRFM310]